MLTNIKNMAFYCKIKVDGMFRRVFKEQAGGAELIATLIIVGIVLVLAFAFKDKIGDLVKELWNNIVRGDNPDAKQAEIIPEWS